MKLGDYKLIFVAVGLIGVLLIASPAIAGAIRLPGGEQFSELYLLGPDQMAENYPSQHRGRPELLRLRKCWKPFRIFSLLRHYM